jgi:hypothetical protein
MTIISVPTGPPAEDLLWITSRKMEPLWALRASLRVENGAAFSLLDGEWRLRLGDAKVTGGQGHGRIRGMVVEVEFGDVAKDEVPNRVEEERVSAPSGGGGGGVVDVDDVDDDDDWDGREKLLRNFWDSLVRESGVSMERLQVVVKVPGVAKGEKVDLTLVRQYMELLRFART